MNALEKFGGIRVEDLPASLHEIERLIGLKPTLALVAACGGNATRVPAVCGAEHPLARAVGAHAANKICRHYAGEQVYIPSAAALLRNQMHKEIVRRYGENPDTLALARRYGLTRRTVQKIIAKARP